MYKVGLANIFNRLVARFRLTVFEQSIPLVSPIIQPITDVSELVKVIKTSSFNVAADSSGWKAGTIVPAGKRWLLHAVTVNRSTGATATCNGVSIRTQDGTLGHADDECYILYTSAASTIATTFGNALPLDTGGILDLYAAAGNAGDVLSLLLHYTEEDAF